MTGRSRRLLSSAVHRLFDAGRFPRGPAYLGDHRSLVATRWGGALVVDTRDTLMAPALLLEGIWERDITDWLMATLGKGHVFVDIGANIGYYTLLARRLVGDTGRVVAVEAHPELGALLRRNLLMNGIRDVHVVEKAAWSETAVVDFHLRTHFGVNSSVGSLGDEQLKVHADEETTVQVAAVPLDEVLADLPRVDLIKLDVEGSELHALRGLERTIQRNPSAVMMMEWCPGQLEMVGGAPGELVDLLQGWGFGFKVFELGLRPVPPTELLDLPYANLVLSRSSSR